MKPLWIALAVVLGMGVLCCGGTLFMCNRTYRSVAAHNDEADRFAKDVLQQTAADWKLERLLAHAAPELTESVTKEELQKFLDTSKEKLGKLKRVDEFTASSIQSQVSNGVTSVIVQTKAPDVEFEKGRASVRITAVKRGNAWKVVSFYVKPL